MKRISPQEALELFDVDLLTLGKMAHGVRQELHPENRVTFCIDRNINYTNVCTSRCAFCAFWREKDHPQAYLLPREELFKKIEETLELGGTSILIQGGLHPGLKIDYFEDLFSSIKARYPIHIHGLSPPEIWHIARNSGLTLEETIGRLKRAGLGSIPGGGAEILSPG
jgi:cyclic dehypoxanthinyl futalosine synthase